LDEAEAGLEIIGDEMSGNDLAGILPEPDVLGLGHEIADGEDEAVAVDEHALAGALGAGYGGRESVGRHLGREAHNGIERVADIEAPALGLGAKRLRKFPIAEIAHDRSCAASDSALRVNAIPFGNASDSGGRSVLISPRIAALQVPS